MKQAILASLALFTFLFLAETVSAQGTVPEILYYKFNQTGTAVTNEASAPPAGTVSGTINGGQTQGGSGLCGGALIGTGGSSNADYMSTGWNTNLGTSAWTIAFWTDNIPNTTTLYYHFGDAGAASLRCFNNGVAGADNFILRGPVADVLCTGCAPIGAPSMTVFVYDPVAGDIKAYHNGVLNNTVAQGALNISGSDFKVGGYSGSTGLGPAEMMDEFRFYDRALDAQEVFDTYDACLPLSTSPDDAGVASIDEPTNFCAGTQDVVATIRNYGVNQIDSVLVQWEIDAVAQTPYNYVGLLDTVGGVGPNTAQITLGSALFAAGVTYNIIAWTELPNNVMDTVNNNDTTAIIVQSSLSGNFTIGGTTPDYPDFSTAVADLNSFGICGPVVFDVRSGTYTEQVSLGSVNGASTANTIVFRSEDANRDSVILTFASTTTAANYTFNFNGADHVSLEQMTIEATGPSFGRVLQFGGVADSNSVWDCRMLGVVSTSTSANYAVLYSNNSNDSYNSFTESTFENGSYAIYWWGAGTTSLEEGTIFQDNEILNSYNYGSYLYYQDAPTFVNNTYRTNSGYTGLIYGFNFGYCDNASLITGNSAVIGPDNYGYGLYFNNCDGAAGAEGLVYNNMISVGNPSTTSTSTGLYLTNSSRLNISHNSFYIQSGGGSSRGVYATGGGLVTLTNNNFVLNGLGYAAYYNSQYTVSEADYNNYYTEGGSNFIFTSGGNVADIAAYQTASGQGANSISTDPMFQSFEDLHVCNDTLNGAGTPIAQVTVDIDGTPRDASTPDIGADEFAPLTGDFLGTDELICTGEVLTLWAGSPADTILWSTGDTTQSIDVTLPGTYFVDVISVCGNGSDTIIVEASALVYTDFVEADTTFFCTPGSATLSSTMPGTAYAWSTTETTPTIAVTASGTYFLTVTDACGTGTDSVVVVGATTPVASFTNTASYVTAFFTNTTVAEGTVSYSWDFGDGNTSTDENPTHIYTAAGTYTVTLTVTNECGTDTITNSVTVTTVGLDEIGNGNSLSIYPNPNNGTFTLDILLAEKSSVEVIVTNELGQKIYTNSLNETVGSKLEMIDLGKVESGLYFITVVVNESPYISKFIVK